MLPSSQAELIRAARGVRTQAEFAKALGVDRTCLSRYEREVLGAPPSVITQCLREVVRMLHTTNADRAALSSALRCAREVVSTLESATQSSQPGKAEDA